MRPALLRLLKRPSTISLLTELVSTPWDIERVATRNKCISCQRRRAHAKPLPLPESFNTIRRTDPSQKLQVHKIIDCHTTEILNGKNSAKAGREPHRNLSLDADRLEYESSLGSDDINGRKRLVDHSGIEHDFGLWKELLQYRKRRYGSHGVAEILKGLIDRKDDIQLPVEGKLADYFWGTFVDAGLEDEKMLCEITEYAEHIWYKKGKRWEQLYTAIIGGLFAKGLPVQAVSWHRKLQPVHLSKSNDIAQVIVQAVLCNPDQPADPHSFSHETMTLGFRPGLRAFGELCLAAEGHQVYDAVVPLLIRKGYHLDAVFMHEFLVKRGDTARDVVTVEQLLEFAETESHNFSRKVRDRIKKVKPSLESCREALTESSAFESSISYQCATAQKHETDEKRGLKVEEDHWIKEKTFKDEFGARLFATKALTVDMITNGLQMFGVHAIGPLSLREIALRADGPKDILEKMRALRKADITIRDCAFTRLVERLATEHKDILLEDLLHSDQHPDVLEDAKVQENFLCSYLMARDWRLYNLTKAILGDVAKDDLDNIQFRVSLTAREWSAASDIADKIYLDGKSLSEHSINHMVNNVLTSRLPGRHPPYDKDRKVDEVGYVLRILKLVFRSQGGVNAQYWIEILQRLGKHRHDQWEQLRELCLWLAQNYGAQDNSPFLHSLSRSSGVDAETILSKGRTELRHIFNPRLQMAIISWGFKLPLWKLEEPEMSCQINGKPDSMVLRWVRGLLLLRELEAMGVTIYPSFVRQACRERLQMLYGELPSVRDWNQTLRTHNTFKLSRVLNDMLKIYPSLFSEQERREPYRLIIDRPLSAMATRRLRQQEEWQQQ